MNQKGVEYDLYFLLPVYSKNSAPVIEGNTSTSEGNIQGYIGTYDGVEHPIVDVTNDITYTEGATIYYLHEYDEEDRDDEWTTVPVMVKDVLDSGKYCIRAEKNGIWSNPVYVETSISAANLTITTYGANKVYDGQPLTDGTANGFIDGLRGSDRAKIVCTGTQTQFGESYNTYDIIWGDEDLEKNYTITSSLGLLVVGKRTVEIDWGTLEFAYAEGVSQGPSPQIRNKVAGDDVSLTFDGTLSAEVAGTYSISITGISGDDAANYELPSAPITKTWKIIEEDIAATILFAEDFTYDGTSHDLVSVTVTNPADPNDYTVLYSVNDGEYTTTVPFVADAGTYVVKVKINATINGVDKERPEEEATIIVAPKAIDDSMHITGIGSAYTYTGEDIAPVPSITWNGNVVSLDTDCTVGYSDNRNVGVAKVTMTGKGNYTGSLTKEFTIEPKAVTVKANDASKTYGDTDPTLTAEVTGLLGEDTITYTLIRVAGENVDSYTITASGATIQGNYFVSYVSGKFTILPAGMTVTENNVNVTYDGSYHSATVSVTSVGSETATIYYSLTELTADNYTSGGTTALKFKNAGSTTVYYYAVTDNSIPVSGSLSVEIAKRAVTLTSGSATKTYDGTALKNDTVTVIAEGFVYGEGATYNVTGFQIGAGSSNNAFTYALNDGTVAINYDISKVEGTLKVDPKTVIVTADDDTKTYGSADPALGVTISGLLEGDSVAYDISREAGENVGKYTVTVTGDAEQGNYVVTFNNGNFVITSKDVTVKADDKSKVYGGSDPELTATVEGRLGDDKISYTLSRVAGDNVGTYTITASGAAEQGNYTVSYKIGKFTIEKAPLTVTVNGITGSKVYNGLAQTISGYTLAYTDSIGKFSVGDVAGSLTVSGTDVGTYTASAEGFVNNNVNFDVTFVAGDKIALDIVKKAITVTAIDGSKIFGDVDPAYGSDIDGLVEGDSIVYTVVRSYGEAYGSYDLTFIGEEDQGNYTVTYIPGIFQILRKDVLVTADTLEKFYGENDPILSATIDGVIDDVLIDFTIYRDSGEDVGTYGIHIYGDAVQGNYNVYFEDSVLTINAPETVTVTIKMVDASGDVLGMSTERYDVGSTVTIILPVPEGYYLLQDRVTVEVTEALVITVKCFTFEEFVDIQEANAEPDNSIVIDHANARLDEQLSGFTWYAPIIVGLLCVVLFLAIGFRSGYSEIRKKF